MPNPTTGIVSIHLKEGNIKNLIVYNSGGKQINNSISMDIAGDRGSLDLSGLPNGIYYIEVQAGKALFRKKVTLLK